MGLTTLQTDIMDFAKSEYFHGTLNDFLRRNPHVNRDEAVQALKELKNMRIASLPNEDFENNWISVTNYGHKVMGW